MSGRFLPRQAALDPLLTKVARWSPLGADYRLARPPIDLEQKITKRFPLGADSVSLDPDTTNKSGKPFKVKIPRLRPLTFQRLRRLTCKAGSNSHLRITERGMTEDEYNRGRGPNPSGGWRIFTSHIRDPCGCHASGIPSREALSPRDLANGSDIHRDCLRVF